MPIPLILGAIAAAGAAVGVGKGLQAMSDNDEAKRINADAQEIYDSAQENLGIARDLTKNALEELGEKKLEICQGTLTKFVNSFGRIKNVELENSAGLRELAKFKIDKGNFAELKEVTVLAGSVASGAASGAAAGAAVAVGAYGAAGALATASTGTAIAGLSGAAATNATLAFFGGGSLAAGGLGVAGGTMVLGALVAGPALAVLGFVMGAKASANLDNARSNRAKARETAEQIQVLISACEGIKERAEMFTGLLGKLDEVLTPMLIKLDTVIEFAGTDYHEYPAPAQKSIAALAATVQATKAMLDTPLLDANGALTDESQEIGEVVNKFLSNQ